MVNISKTIANKIQEKRSDLTSDEVKNDRIISFVEEKFCRFFFYRQFVFDRIYSVLVLIIP
jgi:hypothetical protein